MWHYWLIAAGIFMIGEIMTVGFLLFWLGIASLITMVVSFFTSNLMIQMTVFTISSVVLILATKPFVNKLIKNETTPTNVSSLIGKKARVIQDINPNEGIGQIKVGGEVWSAESVDESMIPKGMEVEIIKIDGVKTIVKLVSSSVVQV